jgi:DNA-binding LacI/PurR family transcriptional regulator
MQSDGTVNPPSGVKERSRLVDVANECGVTVSIVSRVLNGDPTVSARQETRERIFAAARKLSYVPNGFARGLRRSQTMTIGVVLPNLAYAVNAEIIRGAERRAAEGGYVVLVADAAEFGPTSAAYQRLLLEGRVDGVLIGSSTAAEGAPGAVSAFPLPVVLVNRRGTNSGISVLVDDEYGVGLAVDHLVALGHTEIAYITGQRDADTARRRRAGFISRMGVHGLRAPPRRLVETTFTEAGGYEAVRRLLASRRPPTAVVAASLATAVGGMSAVAAHGLRVPDDVSVVGFHDAPVAEYLNPPLSTIRMPLAEMAEAAVDALIRLIDGKAVEDMVIRSPPPQLIERKSTGRPRH